jgi:hypothetical protein
MDNILYLQTYTLEKKDILDSRVSFTFIYTYFRRVLALPDFVRGSLQFLSSPFPCLTPLPGYKQCQIAPLFRLWSRAQITRAGGKSIVANNISMAMPPSMHHLFQLSLLDIFHVTFPPLNQLKISQDCSYNISLRKETNDSCFYLPHPPTIHLFFPFLILPLIPYLKVQCRVFFISQPHIGS